jgi:hypothetical protein
VIWNAHAREMTDLNDADREHLMHVVWQVERSVREIAQPEKINLGSLGNMVPHLHWHVIARWQDDAHFPGSVWSTTSARRHLRARACLQRCGAQPAGAAGPADRGHSGANWRTPTKRLPMPPICRTDRRRCASAPEPLLDRWLAAQSTCALGTDVGSESVVGALRRATPIWLHMLHCAHCSCSAVCRCAKR